MPTFKIIPQIQKILNKLPDGHIVGGFVRDSIMGRTPKDIDMTTSALPAEIKKLYPKHSSLGEKFGTIIIHNKDLQIEVTTMRTDKTSGRHPKVSFTDSILSDLSRRDFKMNAMALDSNLNLIDPFNGKSDISNKIIQTVGNPIITLSKDQLRAIRAIRFSSQLNFQISLPLKEAIKQTSLSEISPDRIRVEFLRSLNYNPVKTIKETIELNLIKFIIPDLQLLQTCEQHPKYHPEGNALEHTLKALTFPHTTPIQKMTILLHDIGKIYTKTSFKPLHYHGHEKESVKHAKKILKALKFSKAETQEILFAIENHMKMHKIQEIRKSKRYALYSNPYFPTLSILHQANTYGRKENNIDFISSDIPSYRPKHLIDGKYLMSIGFEPSKELRKAKEELYDLQIEQTLSTTELQKIAKTRIEKLRKQEGK